MTNDTNITNDKDINANIAHDDHFNDSIVNEVILEDMKKNRIDHMKYLPDMEVLDSDIMDRVVAEMDAYDYDKYTAAMYARRSPTNTAHWRISRLCSRLLHSHLLRKSHRLHSLRPESTSATAYACLLRFTYQTTAKTTVSTVVSTVTIKSTAQS